MAEANEYIYNFGTQLAKSGKYIRLKIHVVLGNSQHVFLAFFGKLALNFSRHVILCCNYIFDMHNTQVITQLHYCGNMYMPK